MKAEKAKPDMELWVDGSTIGVTDSKKSTYGEIQTTEAGNPYFYFMGTCYYFPAVKRMAALFALAEQQLSICKFLRHKMKESDES